MYEAKGTIYECDGCGNKVLQEPNDDKPDGIYGTVKLVTEGWSPDPEPWDWFACKRTCVRKAVMNRLNDVRGGT